MLRPLLSPVVTKAVAGLVVGCALLIVPARAHAQEAAPPPPPPAASSGGGGLGQGFGEAGQIAISGEATAFFSKTNHAGWTAAISPAADYFFMPSISVGGSVTALIGDNSHTGIGVAARAGYNLNFTEQLGVWPIAGIGYAHESSGSGTTSSSISATMAHFYVPVLYHIIPHVFVGLGPFYDLKIAGDSNSSYGVRTTVGGWF
jgi:hypothetical protein